MPRREARCSLRSSATSGSATSWAGRSRRGACRRRSSSRGPTASGKKTLALAVARGMLCEAGPGEPCGACSHCRRIERAIQGARGAAGDGRRGDRRARARLNLRLHPDLVLVEPWRTATRTEIKIEQVRDLVGEAVGRPFEARARVFVDRRRPRHDRAGGERAPEEPRGAAADVAPDPGHRRAAGAAADDPLALPDRCAWGRCPRRPRSVSAGPQGLGAAEAHLRAALAGGSLGAALAFESEAYRELREELLALLESRGARSAGAPGGRRASRRAATTRSSPSRRCARCCATWRPCGVGAATEALLNADVADRLVAPRRAGPWGSGPRSIAEAAAQTRTALRGNANKLLVMDLLMDALAPDERDRRRPCVRHGARATKQVKTFPAGTSHPTREPPGDPRRLACAVPGPPSPAGGRPP